MAAEPELLIRFKGDTKDLESQIEKLKSSLAGIEPATSKAEKGNKKLEDSNKNLGTSFTDLAKGYLTFQAALSAGRFILDSTLQVGKFETQLKTASGSQEKFGQNMLFLEDLANTYKKNVVDLGASFAQLTIATRGTNLEGAETEKLFKAVTVASAALKMSTDDTNGTFRAFIQMVSKGNVQAEELRGQLGERLYGAFNLAAKAMGKTTAELNKMLENGEVLASDLLPKLSTLILNTFSNDASEGAKSLGSSIDYAKGQLTLFVAEFAKISGLTDDINELVKSFGNLTSELLILAKQKGVQATVGGIAGSFLEEFLSIDNKLVKYQYKSPALEVAREAKKRASQTPSLPNFRVDGEIRTEPSFNYIRNASNFTGAAGAESSAAPKAALEKAQKERDRIAKQMAAEEKKDAALQLKLKLQALEAETERAYAKYNGIVGAIKIEEPRGITTGLNDALEATQKFTNETATELGGKLIPNTEEQMSKFALAISVLKNITPADWRNGINTEELKNENTRLSEEGERLDSIQGELVSSLKNLYGSMAGASEAGWAEIVQKVKDGKLTYEEALMGIAKSDAIEAIKEATLELQVDLVSGIAASIGAIAAGSAGMEDLMKNIYGVFGDFLLKLGKQLIVTSGVFKGFSLALKSLSWQAAAVAGIAAVAAGAALKSYATNSGKKASNSFYTGGIVRGPGGVDNIPINVSNGEMILNSRQQSNLFGVLDGAFSADNIGRSYSGSGGSRDEFGSLQATIRGDDLAILMERGKRRLNRYK